MDEQSVLTLGIFVLAGSALGLLFSYRANPLLRGLNWMGSALLVGSLAAIAFIAALHHPAFRPVGDLCLILGFLLGNRATRLCVADTEQTDRADILLLSAQFAATVLQWAHLLSTHMGTLALSVVLALAMTRTARMLHRSAHGRSRPTALFAAALLRIMTLPALLRGVASASGLLDRYGLGVASDTLTYAVFIVGGTVFAFSFFSRTTTQLTAQLEQVASTDPLTRVFNRRAFLNWCEKEWGRSEESGLPFSVLLVDLDHFKRINDNFGHHTGDAVLCAAVESIQNAIRGVDVLCRWGGEEFAVLLPNASQEAVTIVAQRIQSNVRKLSTSSHLLRPGGVGEMRLTVSIGAGTWSGTADTIDAILRRADAALYAAKQAGRDRIVLDPVQSSIRSAAAFPALV